MYTNDFEAPYKHRWETLNIFYNQCQALLSHFEPFTINYEDVVTDFEPTVTSLLSYLGLEYEEGCRDFWKDTRTVITCSKDQVNKPLNTLGLNKWEPYRIFVSPSGD
jgi:hypothetical protein